MAALVVVVGLTYPAFGEDLVRALKPDPDDCVGSNDLPTAANEAEARRATVCLLNARRTAAGLGPLTTSTTLARAARDHSEDMGARRYFAHDTPDGVEPEKRIVAAGYPRTGVTVGENIAWGEEAAGTPAKIVESWMNSRGHRANILRSEFTEVGIGLAYEPPEAVPRRVAVYTTNFGGRLSR